MKNEYDVVIIGGGIIGGAISYELAKYELKTLVLERNPLFADETSRANSGVIHGGFDPKPNKIEARLNVLGNRLWRKEIFKNLQFPRAKVDSLIVAFNAREVKHLKTLHDRGIQNKVPDSYMKMLSKSEVLAKEPNLNPKVVAGFLCTSSWAIDPVKATLAFLSAAEQNGTVLQKNSEVVGIGRKRNGFTIKVQNKPDIWTKNIINAAGHYADIVAEMAQLKDFTLRTRRGEYRILSRTLDHKVNSICFMVPTIHGKGVVVAPMLDGRTMVGPTSAENVLREDTRIVTRQKYQKIAEIGRKLVPKLDMDRTELIISGSRPIDIETDDFIIRYAKDNKNFILAAGMQSPALASAPAIAIEVRKLLAQNGTTMKQRVDFRPKFAVKW